MADCLVLPDGTRVPLAKSVLSIGSAPTCDVVVGHPDVRPQHALAFHDRSGWTVVPAAKGCPLSVGGRRVDAARLQPGQEVSLGKAVLRLEGSAPARDLDAAAVGAALASFAARLLANRPIPELLSTALEGMVDATGADAGFLVVVENAQRHLVASSSRVPASVVADSIVSRVLSSGAPVLIEDVAADQALAGADSVLALGLASALGVPLSSRKALPGVVYLGRRLGRPPFTAKDLESASALSALAALLLEAAGELVELREQVASLTHRIASATFEGIIGESPPMKELRRAIERLGPTPLNVLVFGETGTGKELVARALHRTSGRRGPFVPIHCSALPAELIERELFGHVRGAFTGASSDRPGLFEAACGGTVFLDEIGEMPRALQTRLLRVVQEREVTRIGDVRPRKIDVRIISATHVNLAEAQMRGEFRQDLRYRLEEACIRVPPLRERGDDVLLIAHAVLADAKGRARGFTQKAVETLRGHPFPGNVRELVAAVRRAALLATGDLIGPDELGLETAEEPLVPLEKARDDFVRRYVREAVARCGGSKKKAAELLGIGLRSVFRHLGEGD